jgi:hypothetical protein
VRVVGGDELDVAVHQRSDEGEVAGEAVELGDNELGLVLAAAASAFWSSGRSARLPVSTSVYSAMSFQGPPLR